MKKVWSETVVCKGFNKVKHEKEGFRVKLDESCEKCVYAKRKLGRENCNAPCNIYIGDTITIKVSYNSKERGQGRDKGYEVSDIKHCCVRCGDIFYAPLTEDTIGEGDCALGVACEKCLEKVKNWKGGQ